MNSKAKCLSALNNLVFVALIISLSFSFVQQAGAQIPEGSDTDAGAETFAVHCYNGVAYLWAGSVWNRSSRDMKIYGDIHLGNKQGELTLGPGEDSRDTDMCDVDKVKHDISPPSEWRYMALPGSDTPIRRPASGLLSEFVSLLDISATFPRYY